MKALRAPTVTLIQPLIFRGPAVTSAARAEQGGIMIADNNGLFDPTLLKTITPERTLGTILCLRIEEAAVFDRPSRTQDASHRTLQKVVPGIVPGNGAMARGT